MSAQSGVAGNGFAAAAVVAVGDGGGCGCASSQELFQLFCRDAAAGSEVDAVVSWASYHDAPHCPSFPWPCP